MRWTENVARMGERRGVYRVWWRNLSERGHLGHTVLYRRIILKIDLTETVLEGVDWIDPAQDRDKRQAVVNTAMNIRVQ